MITTTVLAMLALLALLSSAVSAQSDASSVCRDNDLLGQAVRSCDVLLDVLARNSTLRTRVQAFDGPGSLTTACCNALSAAAEKKCFCDRIEVEALEEELPMEVLPSTLYQASESVANGGCGLAVNFINDDGTCTPFEPRNVTDVPTGRCVLADFTRTVPDAVSWFAEALDATFGSVPSLRRAAAAASATTENAAAPENLVIVVPTNAAVAAYADSVGTTPTQLISEEQALRELLLRHILVDVPQELPTDGGRIIARTAAGGSVSLTASDDGTYSLAVSPSDEEQGRTLTAELNPAASPACQERILVVPGVLAEGAPIVSDSTASETGDAAQANSTGISIGSSASSSSSSSSGSMSSASMSSSTPSPSPAAPGAQGQSPGFSSSASSSSSSQASPGQEPQVIRSVNVTGPNATATASGTAANGDESRSGTTTVTTVQPGGRNQSENSTATAAGNMGAMGEDVRTGAGAGMMASSADNNQTSASTARAGSMQTGAMAPAEEEDVGEPETILPDGCSCTSIYQSSAYYCYVPERYRRDACNPSSTNLGVLADDIGFCYVSNPSDCADATPSSVHRGAALMPCDADTNKPMTWNELLGRLDLQRDDYIYSSDSASDSDTDRDGDFGSDDYDDHDESDDDDSYTYRWSSPSGDQGGYYTYSSSPTAHSYAQTTYTFAGR